MVGVFLSNFSLQSERRKWKRKHPLELSGGWCCAQNFVYIKIKEQRCHFQNSNRHYPMRFEMYWVFTLLFLWLKKKFKLKNKKNFLTNWNFCSLQNMSFFNGGVDTGLMYIWYVAVNQADIRSGICYIWGKWGYQKLSACLGKEEKVDKCDTKYKGIILVEGYPFRSMDEVILVHLTVLT